jgi:hypothetical protein
MTPRNGNGGKAWLLGIAGAIIAGMAAVLFALLMRAYDHIATDHKEVFKRIQKLEASEAKRGD